MREHLSLDRNWRFALGHAADDARDFQFARSRCLVKAGEARGAAAPDFDDSGWQQIDVPHDWALELPLDPNGDRELCEHGFHAIGPDHPEHSVGWYRRAFDLPASDLGRRVRVAFDGVFRDSVVWLNGHRLGRHASGYMGFEYDVTDVANYGGRNVLVVRADASSWEGWWYEGAGIYRHTWLTKTDPLHIPFGGVFVRTQVEGSSAIVQVQTRVRHDADGDAPFELVSQVLDDGGRVVAEHIHRGSVSEWDEGVIEQALPVPSPRLWSCESPTLYRLVQRIVRDGGVCDELSTTFGIRTLALDAKRGFLLNGERVQIKGACIHRDHAGVGVALPDRLHELRVQKLKEMGANAIRLSHYPAAPELLDVCDREGMLVLAENRLASSSPECLDVWRRMILRDRNHPSVFLWSIGNEEHTIQWSIAGERIGRTMIRIAKQLDPTREVTAAMHDRGLGEGFANVVTVHGWNYIAVGDLEAFHARRPEQPIIGTEEGSTVCTRGIYADDPERGYVSAYDERTPKWGSTAQRWWRFYAERPWLAGAFVWTGFDYRGEPIPYKWPCTGSHFGLMDQCGFPKDLYWYFKAWWSDRPVLHLFPHWNWPGREGQEIDVRCFSNHEEVELLLNGRSLGVRKIERNGDARWMVPYEPGRLVARGYRGGELVQETIIETTDEPVKLVLTADRPAIRADGEDCVCVRVCAQDRAGREVPTADALVHFEVSGAGRLIGVGNGDPSSHESDKSPQRRLFSGLALAIVQSQTQADLIRFTARADGLESATIEVPAVPAPRRPSVP